MFVIRERLYAHPVEQKCLESSEMWCWEDRVRDEVSRGVKYMNIVRKRKGRK
jgi:hypothetical protein